MDPKQQLPPPPLSLSEHCATLRRQWLLIAIITIAGTLAGGILQYTQLSKYKATSCVQIQPYLSRYNAKQTRGMSTHSELMMSQANLSAVVERLRLSQIWGVDGVDLPVTTAARRLR